MMGSRVHLEKMFYDFSLNQRVLEDYFPRKVAEVVDLDFVGN